MKIGAAWLKDRKDASGNVVMVNGRPQKNISIVIEIPFLGKINLMCLKNDEKKNDSSPDFDVIWFGEDNRQQGGGGGQQGRGGQQGSGGNRGRGRGDQGGYDDEGY